MNGTQLLRSNRHYRNLWLASIGSQFGNWFNEVALAQVTLILTHSPAAMGFVLLCRSLPSVMLGPFAGPFVDRFPKKRILALTDFVRAVFALALILPVLLHVNWILYLDSALLGTSGVLFGPARNSVIPLIVSDDGLAAANGLESQASGFIQIIGAATGGAVAATIGSIACFCINAASYLWSAWYILQCRWEEKEITTQQGTGYLQALRVGFREALHNRVARSIILIGISWGLAGGGYYILIPVLGQQVYHMGGLGIGLLYVIDGVGVLIGAYAVNRYVGHRHRRAVVWYGVAYVTQALFFGVMTQFTVFAWGALMLLLMRISSGIIIPLDTYMLQTNTDPKVRGRIFALHGSTYGGVMQLSYAVMGLALSRFGVPVIGLVIGAISLLCGVTWLAQFGRKSDGVAYGG
ncbi:MFS transporter [Alicyclobacillus sp. ALC3]|uniref:MFS transporter n=1 Tax=Alicyclobacillus sp. ALC3 TaxID=2796143 RepID=UPI0023791DDC|nr:MFS transporter [Alicyclobacillus sp. ALC3]WDL96727.1 MFS transporter [Alicyclobacillus sp. ALC3]